MLPQYSLLLWKQVEKHVALPPACDVITRNDSN